MIRTATIVGSGNVAWHLGKALSKAGIEVKFVFSRNAVASKKLAQEINASFVSEYAELKPTDIVILAAPDDVVPSVSKLFPAETLVVHTSGSVTLSELRPGRRGVFYPLQTFSKVKEIDFSQVPLCLEAENENDQSKLVDLARKLSNTVELISSEQRRQLHLAAVFVSNFANQLYREAEEILATADIKFDLLKPLIKEVTHKLDTLSPREAMTGPARRNDSETINRHLSMLENDEQLRTLYRLLTDRIISDHQE